MPAIRYNQARFAAAYGTPQQLKPSTAPEVIMCGRSNVGKSSLINKLLGRKALAKVSQKPGKTATINFYDVDGIYLVDLPGYGFAKVSQAERQRWSDLIGGYFAQERSFNLVICLVDIRHEPQPLDHDMVEFLIEQELPFVVALTKADKLSKSKQFESRDRAARALGIDHSQIVITSSETGQGTDELKRLIAEACL